MNLINHKTYRFKIEVTTTDGFIYVGYLDGKKHQFKPGDFVEITIKDRKFYDIKVLDSRQFDPLWGN